MRPIDVEEGLRIRFPNQPTDFDDGVEAGIAAALMVRGAVSFTRPVSAGNVAQLQALAEKLGWHLVAAGPSTEGCVDVLFRPGRARVALRLVETTSPRRDAFPRPPRSVSRPCLSIAGSAGAPERTGRLLGLQAQEPQTGRVS